MNDNGTIVHTKVGLVIQWTVTAKCKRGLKVLIIFCLTLFNDDVKSKGFQ